MKKKLIYLLLIMLCHNGIIAQKTEAKKQVTPETASLKLSNLSDTLQYAIGAYLAKWVNDNGFAISNAPLFLKGMDDKFRNLQGLLPDSMIVKLVVGLQQLSQKEIGLKTEEKIFNSLKDQPGLGMLPSGVRYFIVNTGEGVHPSQSDTVVIHIKGTTPDGTVFEDTYLKKQPVSGKVSSLIPGIAQTIPMMGVGDRWKLYIPSKLAYGEKGSTLIPANSTLIIDITLLDVRSVRK
ncbi:MAG TPA: FKBP-type peptidyl-prolyl cis-trans isomerase [Sediminibacterium sp.]|jgi:FKBP-type peptidyl-prolyl cis-trans isomerase